MRIKPKIIFAGLAQNCAPFLLDVLKNIERMSSVASESAFIFLENDSKDSTKNHIQEWGKDKKNFKFINLDGLSSFPVRSMRLEFLRNTYIEAIRADDQLRQFDLLIVVDMDDVSSYAIDLDRFQKALNFLDSQGDFAGVFPNQIGTYYDMWALRHRKFCPSDIWEEAFDYAREMRCSDKEAFDNTFAKKIFSIDENEPPIEVDSAFGGLGIYKMKFVLENPNPYVGVKIKIMATSPRIELCRWQLLEHAHFHKGIKNLGGKLFILPYLINGDNTGLTFPESGFRMMPF